MNAADKNPLPSGRGAVKDITPATATAGCVIQTLHGVTVGHVDFFDQRAGALRCTLINGSPWSWHGTKMDVHRPTLPVPLALRDRLPGIRLSPVLVIQRG